MAQDPITTETLRRIIKTLEGSSVMLRRSIDVATRQAAPKLHIWHNGEECMARWDGQPEFNFTDFMLRQTIRFGELNGNPAIATSHAIAMLVAFGYLSLPGFTQEAMANGDRIFRPEPSVPKSR